MPVFETCILRKCFKKNPYILPSLHRQGLNNERVKHIYCFFGWNVFNVTVKLIFCELICNIPEKSQSHQLKSTRLDIKYKSIHLVKEDEFALNWIKKWKKYNYLYLMYFKFYKYYFLLIRLLFISSLMTICCFCTSARTARISWFHECADSRQYHDAE